MKSIVFKNVEGKISYNLEELNELSPKENEVKVKVLFAGMNRRDLFVSKGSIKNKYNFTLGSDAIGIIEEVGINVTSDLLNKKVIINPMLNWEKKDVVPQVLNILGGPENGTFSNYLVIDKKNVLLKPDYLSDEEASAFSLSAMTAYRALFSRGELTPDKTVLIPGIGGGVGLFALYMSKAIGAKVIATSRNKESLDKAKELGADIVLNTEDLWSDVIGSNNVDVIIDSVGSKLYEKYFSVIKANGKIVSFGASSGANIDLNLRDLFFPQVSIIGTSMGSSEEFYKMIELVEKYKIKPIIDKIYSLEDYKEAFKDLEFGKRFGKLIFKCN